MHYRISSHNSHTPVSDRLVTVRRAPGSLIVLAITRPPLACDACTRARASWCTPTGRRAGGGWGGRPCHATPPPPPPRGPHPMYVYDCLRFFQASKCSGCTGRAVSVSSPGVVRVGFVAGLSAWSWRQPVAERRGGSLVDAGAVAGGFPCSGAGPYSPVPLPSTGTPWPWCSYGSTWWCCALR